MRISSIGNVLVGSSSSIEVASSAEAQLQIQQASDGSRLGLSLMSIFNGSGPAAILALGHGRGSTSGVLQDNDVIGNIRFAGGDGTDCQTIGASIDCKVDGTPSGNVMPALLTFNTNSGGASATERMRIDASGNVGIGVNLSSIQSKLNVKGSGDNGNQTVLLRLGNDSSGSGTGAAMVMGAGAGATSQGVTLAGFYDGTGTSFTVGTNASFNGSTTERMRINSSGSLLLGTTTDLGHLTVSQVQNDTSSGTFTDPHIRLDAANTTNNTGFTGIAYSVSTLSNYGWTAGAQRVSTGGGDGAFVMRHHSNSATGNERLRLSSSGYVHMGDQTINDPANNNSVGLSASGVIGFLSVCRNSDIPLVVGITGSDTQLIRFMAQGSQEGNISVSGSTVSYNGGHLSRWSQIKGISTTDKSARPTIYQGTVMSNLDDLCVWSYPDQLYTEQDKTDNQIPEGKDVGDIKKAAHTEENQQLNMTKVSDTEGDKDVAGVFWTWDDTNDDYYVNDYYIAMTGDMIIRVASSTTVARGDLLISAGDGTAKPQADDIIRSSTIAKITSTNPTATYADGSKAYPCVLMAC